MSADLALETFPALAAVGFVRHGFTQRAGGIDVKVDRELALARLDAQHTKARTALGGGSMKFITATQVHGNNVASVNADSAVPAAAADGLITASSGVCLGIYVADCCAVYLVDPIRRAIGLLHSGKKGTELGIAAVAIEKMRTEFGSNPRDLVAQLSPCIRPPNYEVDFASIIIAQCRAAGVQEVHDCGTCTAANLDTYYSYRAERGKTGRMLALLAMADPVLRPPSAGALALRKLVDRSRFSN